MADLTFRALYLNDFFHSQPYLYWFRREYGITYSSLMERVIHLIDTIKLYWVSVSIFESVVTANM